MKRLLGITLLLVLVGGCAMTPQQQAFWREYGQRAHERELARIYAEGQQQEPRLNTLPLGSFANPIYVQPLP